MSGDGRVGSDKYASVARQEEAAIPADDNLRNARGTLDRGKLENAIRHHLFTHEDAAAAQPLEGTIHFRQFLSALLEPDGKYFDAVRIRLKSERVPLLVICETLIGPVSTELGRMWCDDRHSFGTITAASARMQLLLNNLSDPPATSIGMEARPRILLMRMPGNDHTLGLSVIAAVFEDEGWSVDGGASLEMGADALRMVREGGYTVIGLSVSALNTPDEVRAAVKRLRKAAPGPDIRFLVGGASVARHLDAFRDCGADFIAADVRDALKLANGTVHNAIG